MTTETIPGRQRQSDDYIVRDSAETGGQSSGWYSGSATQTAHRPLRGNPVVVPLIMAVAFAGPSLPMAIRRRFSEGGRSRSEIIDFRWTLDDWVYTEESGTMEQIAALNALLALPAVEGFSLDLPD